MHLALTLVILAGWKASTADVELPVPKGWELDDGESQPAPTVPAKGHACTNRVWFDVVPGASLEYSKQLIATESLEATIAIRRWDVQPYRELQLAKRPAAAMSNGAERTVYVVPFDTGSLIIQAMGYGEQRLTCVPLHDDVAATLAELFFSPRVQEKVKRMTKGRQPPPLNVLEPVPATLDEALVMLEQKLDAAALAEIRKSSREDEMARFHFGTGSGIRNAWGLWGGSPLAKSFRALGVLHPDQMSGIIMRSLWRKLHGQPIDLEGQAARARRYWDLRRTPAALQPCRDGGTPKVLMGLEADDRFVQIYACGPGTYQAFELDAGWYAPDEKVRKRVEALRRDGNVVSAPLEEGRGGTVIDLGKLKK